jgi:predicted nucleotidyltransferase
MIPHEELQKAIELARKYEVDQFYLIGSASDPQIEEPHDYDFAVKGIPEEMFFKLYSELYMSLSKEIDLIDLSGEMTKFKNIILKEGTLVYDKSSII